MAKRRLAVELCDPNDLCRSPEDYNSSAVFSQWRIGLYTSVVCGHKVYLPKLISVTAYFIYSNYFFFASIGRYLYEKVYLLWIAISLILKMSSTHSHHFVRCV